MEKKIARPKEHTLGHVRYLTYRLIFPDGDEWLNQTHFFGPVSTWLRLTVWARNHMICTDLLRRGETRWKDRIGVIHRLVIESQKREMKWGRTPQKKEILT